MILHVRKPETPCRKKCLLLPALLLVLCCGCGVFRKPDVPQTGTASYLLHGTDENTTLQVTVLSGAEEGPLLYLVAGTHGDEIAGRNAAAALVQRAYEGEVRLTRGTLIVLAEANPYGVREEKRKTKQDLDVNRAYPGDPSGKDAQRIADAVFRDVEEKKPDLVLDLHEAKRHTDGKDNLGNSLVCADTEPVFDLIMGLLEHSGNGTLALSSPLSLYASPPAGSLNKTVTEQLHIPVITVETDLTEDLSVRTDNHLAVIRYILQAYGMI